MKKNLPFLLLPLLFASAAAGQAVTFYKENVVMTLDGKSFNVTGEYFFRNNYGTETNQTIYFPIPMPTADLKLDSVSVYDELGHRYLQNVRVLRAGLFFQLIFHGNEQKRLRICYIMDHDGKNARYLVSTHIQYWKKTLAQGNYTLLIIDPTIAIDSTSYMPDGVSSADNRITQTWRKVNFNPDREFEVWFHRR